MVEAVAQVGARLGHDERRLGAHDRQDRLALGPLDAMEGDQRTPRLVDVAERLLGRVAQRLVLELLQVIGEAFDQGELAIDDQVDQGIDLSREPAVCRRSRTGLKTSFLCSWNEIT